MKKIGLIVVLAIIAIIVINAVSTYNSLVNESEVVDKAWANVETQYQRRFDLIPNLVETVKAYAKHESETYVKVTEARAGLQNAYDQAKSLQDGDMTQDESLEAYSQAQNDLNKAFSIYVNAVTEAYPDLKANEQFESLMVQLEGTENRIATERGYYNDAVMKYNIYVRKFPTNIWAGMFGYQKKPQFKADQGAQNAPKVQF